MPSTLPPLSPAPVTNSQPLLPALALMKDGHMPLSNSLPLLQMYKHIYIQTFKLGSGEHKAGGQLTYSNLLAGQSFVDVQLKVSHLPCMQCRLCSQRGPRKGSHTAYLTFWHPRPDLACRQSLLKYSWQLRTTISSSPALSSVRDCHPQKQAHPGFLACSR